MVHGTPIVTGRAALWTQAGCVPTGRYGCGAETFASIRPSCGCRNASNIANLLNDHASFPNASDPSSSASYSIIPVDVWTLVGTVQAVLDTIHQLDNTKIEVVGIDALVKMIRENVIQGSNHP